jgi:hypothetical protein
VKLLILLLFGCALFAGACANDSTDDHPQHRHHRHGHDQTETNERSDNPSPTPALGL